MSAELAGTTTGYPFGAYSYTAFLNPKILGHVPYLIPPSWYAVSVLSWELAGRMSGRTVQRVLIGALFMVLWDVALDPAMGAGFPVWRWETEGFFYGMPALNWIGWFITALVIMGGYEAITRGRPPAPNRWTIPVWLANGAFAVAICVVTGLWLAVVVGALAILAPIALPRFRRHLVLSPAT
jgi:putative membrane protein